MSGSEIGQTGSGEQSYRGQAAGLPMSMLTTSLQADHPGCLPQSASLYSTSSSMFETPLHLNPTLGISLHRGASDCDPPWNVPS